MATTRRFSDISADTVYFGALGTLMLASLFFAVSVELRRGQWFGQAEQGELPTGTALELVRVIDGDEVSVRAAGMEQARPFVLRLLGVKAFEANLNDPTLAAVGQTTVRRLERRVSSAEALSLEYDSYVIDRKQRLVAYLVADGRDVGLDLLIEGSVLAYTRYPFSRSDAYVDAEAEARRTKAGLWGSPDVVVRAEALHAQWQSEASP